jgi:hypothetical protein
VDPGAVLVGDGHGVLERVERPRVHVARLQRHDRRPVRGLSERVGQRVRAQPPLVVGGDGVGPAQAEVAQHQVHAVVPLLADQHPHGRRAGQPALGLLPSGPPQHLVPGRRQAGEVGHRGPGREADRRLRGKAEQVGQPTAGHVLDRGGRRGDRAQPRVLVPGADQPVRGQRGGMGAADDEAEEPAGGHRGETCLAGGGKQVDDVGGLGGPVRQVAAQRGDHVRGHRPGWHRPGVEGAEPVQGMLVGPGQGLRAFVHADNVPLGRGSG